MVITDLGMPYVDGRKVASAVKAARAYASDYTHWLGPTAGGGRRRAASRGPSAQ